MILLNAIKKIFLYSPIVFTFESKPLYEGTLVLATLVQKPDLGVQPASRPGREAQTSTPSRKETAVNDTSRAGETSSRHNNLPTTSTDDRGKMTSNCSNLNEIFFLRHYPICLVQWWHCGGAFKADLNSTTVLVIALTQWVISCLPWVSHQVFNLLVIFSPGCLKISIWVVKHEALHKQMTSCSYKIYRYV